MVPGAIPGMADRTHDDDALRTLLSSPRRIAMLGASPDPTRDSNRVFKVLVDHGHDVIPVHPKADAVHGVACARSLAEATERWGSPPDVVDVFRAPDALPGIVDEVLQNGATWLWCQLGVVHDAAIQAALDGGLEVVADRCIKIEQLRLAP